jgi:hypothetical protein
MRLYAGDVIILNHQLARRLAERGKQVLRLIIRNQTLRLLIAGLSASILIVFLVVIAPPLIYPDIPDQKLDNSGIVGKDRFAIQDDRAKIQNDLRSTLLQALAGIVLAFGAYATWRQMQNSREVHSTDRFIRAVDQLGREDRTTEVALGGIFGLERVARDSPKDRRSIGEMLTAYVRTRSKAFENYPDATLATLLVRAPDVQAAVSVLGRGGFANVKLLEEEDIRVLDLSSCDLRHADLSNLDLRGAWMGSARLYRAFAVGAELSWIDFGSADMRNIIANQTVFKNAWFHWANCRDGHFFNANFEGAIFQGADFQGADLTNANFKCTFLSEANFSGAKMAGVRLKGSVADENTV